MVFYIVFYIAAFFLFYHLIDRIVKKSRQSKSKGSNDSRSRSAFTPRTVTYTTPTGMVNTLYVDALKQAHLLIAGKTGSGKSVVENGIIDTLLHRLPFDKLGNAQMILIDPKGNELYKYAKLPHTLVYAYQPEEMLKALQYAMDLTTMRFRVLRESGDDYYNGSDVYVFIDEFADLMTTQGKTVKPLIQRLCQLGRAARVHVVICTQTPIAKVIPTEIKCNFDSRFGLRTRSAQDSRNIIGKTGLELLPEYGEGYYMTPKEESYYKIPYVTKDEIRETIAWWEDQMQQNGLNPRKAA